MFPCRLGGDFGSGDKKQQKQGKMELLLTFRHKTPQSIYIRPVDLLVGHQMRSQQKVRGLGQGKPRNREKLKQPITMSADHQMNQSDFKVGARSRKVRKCARET